jgi:tetratricopeptide (TPR) repeat protein
MGTVYLADQLEPVERKVALKLLRGSLHDPTHVARFNIEQQALARMSHPAIAQVYDAGTTHDGRPFFAMEHVPGLPITAFCNEQGLGLRQRLELFAKVCWGVQHAHQKGMIHRDLKPGNILVQVVDGQPSPKIIDFGIATTAHATDEQPSAFRQTISGTPPYMSPEQADASQSDLDTRSDIYSLGAVLYELLTGTTPLDAAQLLDTPLEQLGQVLHDTDFEPPSRRLEQSDDALSAMAETEGERRRIRQRLRSEVDAIVSRAMAKDRADRYATAAALALDVEAFLEGGPVAAVPQTFRYRVVKLASRHKALIASGAAVAGALLIGLALATAGFLQARQQRDRALEAEAEAKTEAAKSEQIAGFTMGILAGVDPAVAGSMDKTLIRRLLEDAAGRIGSELGDQPEVAAAIHYTIGATYSALGEYDTALGHLASSVELLERELGRDDPSTLTAIVELSLVNRRLGRFETAEVLLVEATGGLKASLGSDNQNTLSAMVNLASLQMLMGRFEDAETLYAESLDACRRLLGPDSRDTLTVANNLGLLYTDNGKFDLAEPLYLEVLSKSRSVFGPDHPDTLNSMNNLAALYEQQGRFDEAETLYLEAIDGSRRVMGPDHPETLNTMNNLAVLYSNAERIEDAESLQRQVLEGSRRVLGPDHPDTLNSMSNLASVLGKLERWDESYELLADAAARARSVLPPDSVLTGGIISNYGLSLIALRRYREAEAALLESGGIFERALGSDHQLVHTNNERLEILYDRWRR